MTFEMTLRQEHLLHGVVAGGEGGAHGMANLVIGNQTLGLAVHHGRALHACHDAVHAVVHLLWVPTEVKHHMTQKGGGHTIWRWEQT